MAYTAPTGLRDKEYNSYITVQTGSVSSVAVTVVSGTLAGTPVTISGTSQPVWSGVGSVMIGAGVGSVVISGTSIPTWRGIGSVLLCGYSGATILALRCLNDGTLLVSGI